MNKKLGPVLVLDDSPKRHKRLETILMNSGCYQIRHAFTAQEAITALGHSLLNDYPFQMLCLDHDLGTFDDGRTVVNWLTEFEYPKTTKVLIHSQNPVGAQAMSDILTDKGYENVQMTPYKSA